MALRDVNLCFPPSGITAIIGPNGAGKTTLLNVITGFIRADAGRCFLGSRLISQLPAYRIGQLGIARTFQDLRLIPQASVLDNVLLAPPHQQGEKLAFALLRIGVAGQEERNRDNAVRILDSVGLKDKKSQLAGELSWGQQKLLTLACCLAAEASILLLDEPVAGVHPELVAQILSVLRRVRDDRRLIIFIEHDIATVRELADHLIVVEGGRVIAEGTPNEVLDRREIIDAYVG